MRIDLAPMEGITNYVYRPVFARHFGGVDRYYTPFISPSQNYSFTGREKKEIDPERNRGLVTVPQLLTNRADYFIWTCEQLEQMGYEEVNLNLGCPSGTVVAKGKGSGFLSDLDGLERFFDEVFAKVRVKVSVKTRLGRYAPEEFEELLEIYSRYPIEELTVHPRYQKEFYRGHARWEWFRYAAEHTRLPLVYNGDVFTAGEAERLRADYPDLRGLMLGRGLIANPFLAREVRGERGRDKAVLKAFLDELLEEYCRELSGDRPVLCRMKENWVYLIHLFENGERYLKDIRKAERVDRYRLAVERLFDREELSTEGGFCP